MVCGLAGRVRAFVCWISAESSQINAMVGDGTSTATILAHAIFADGVRNVVAGASAVDIKRGLHRPTKRSIEAPAAAWAYVDDGRAMTRQIARSRSMLQAGNDFLWQELLDAAASVHNYSQK
jgi:chaperonin GroEL (HSP60 family)